MLLNFGPNKLWRLFPKVSLALAPFLVIAVLYHTCSACNSEFVWTSLSLRLQNSPALQFNRSSQPIVPSRRPPADHSRDAVSALADSRPPRPRPADQITIAQRLAPAASQMEEEELPDGHRDSRRAKFEGDDSGDSTKDGPSGKIAENLADQAANGSEIGVMQLPSNDSEIGMIQLPRAEEVESGLRNPQLPDMQLASSSPEAEPAREPPAQARHESLTPSSEVVEFESLRLQRMDCQKFISGFNISAGCTQKPAWLLKLEHNLYTAKHAIATAAAAPLLNATDLHAPLYLNVSKFRKSYELMEQTFRIFVYEEGAPPLVHRGPIEGIYATEGRFIRLLQQNRQFVVKDPKKAHLFFLPYSVANMVIKLYVPDSHNMRPLTQFITDYVNLIASKHPYWNTTHGADHFFVSCHDWGPATARGHAELRRNGIKAVCNADMTEEFVLHRDISLPEIYLHGAKPPTSNQLGGPKPGGSRRPYLAFFAGHMHGRVRPKLLELWKDKDPSMKIYEMLPATVAKKRSYVRHMKMSKFCICAMGFEVNSPRIVEAIYYDCVPVIIADNFVLPFSDVLNWEAFSLVVKEEELPLLKQILLSISPTRYLAMQARLQHVRQHFMWHHRRSRTSSPKYDAFHMILHSLWLSRLASLPS